MAFLWDFEAYTCMGTHSYLLILIIAVLLLPLVLHPFNSLFSRTTWVNRYQKRKTGLDSNEARDDGVLGCSGIGYANSLHLVQTDNHINISSLNLYGRMLFLTPN